MAEFRPTFAEIDLSALRHNVRVLRQLGNQQWICPMVKGDAYGHGIIEVARTLEKENVDAVGAALVEEGVALRKSIRSAVLVFGWFTEDSARACVENRLTPVISRMLDLEIFSRLSTPHGFPVHLKFNTGMNRLGFAMSEVPAVKKKVEALALKVVGICSHLAHGEDWNEGDGVSLAQARRLKDVASHFKDVDCLHLLNSAALLKGEDTLGLGARPGIAIYGAGKGAAAAGLKPVMSFCTRIGGIHSLNEGDGVSYDFRWRAKQNRTRVAVLPVGYADGLMRLLTNRGMVLVHGQAVPIVGTVCMDYTMVDLQGIKAEVGDSVTLWGRQNQAILSVDKIAELAETISYELLTGVSPRVPRHYTGGD